MKTGGPTGLTQDAFLDRIERAMDVLSKRQQLVASNISNIDTPGYRTVDIDFDAALARAMESPGAAMTEARPIGGLAVRNDGNDVNVDREMLNLAATRGRFEISTEMARLRFKQLRAAIEDGRV